MKAMIFAAGLGTRLRPLTDHCPKALVKVAGVPMLERTINKLMKHGFNDITVNVHHFGEQIIDFLNLHNGFGADIHISDERDMLLDTGGGILKARPFLEGNEPFLVHNADIVSDIDLTALYNQHLKNEADATLVVSDRKTSRKLLFDDSRLRGWTNIETGEMKPSSLSACKAAKYRQLAFSGIHVISPRIFQEMGQGTPWEGKFSIIPFYLGYCQRANIQSYEPCSGTPWFDVGKPETLEQANAYFAAK